MKRSDLLELEKTMMKEVVKRRALGGYSADAEGILILSETLMRLLQYVIDDMVPPGPEPKRKSK
jgi:hypothetical protein